MGFMRLLIKNGRVIDPANNIDEILDVLIEDTRISRVSKDIRAEVDEIIDAAGKIVMPGIVDMHVHLREPGREDKETVLTGTQAALKGGVTSVLAMPNTHPPIDCVENARLLKSIIKKTAKANVFIAATITKGRKGCEITDIPQLKKEGVVAITDDGSSVDSEELFLKTLKKAKQYRILVMCHCEDKSISRDGVVNLGIISTRTGLRGIPREAEYKRVQRDIQLAKRASAPVHITHVSCGESVEIIAEAKRKGVKVTADTAPHYFSLTEEQVLGYDTNMKVNPPLRSAEDAEVLKQGLKNGVIDAIASDHAPHTEYEKDIEFERAAFGVIGLETELAVSLTELVKPGLLGWPELVKKLAVNPARVLKLDKGILSAGKDADIIVVNPDKEWIVSKDGFLSKSKNSAFLGRKLYGVVEYAICNGKIVYKR
jgi:dihydroorotase